MPFFYYVSITTLCLYLPKFGIQMMTPFANKYGLYDFIKRVNEALMAVNLLALLVGFESHMLWGLLVVIQMVLFASWGFYDLIMADVIDGDRVKNKRKESVSTSVHGVQALIVKPSQSLAPMLGVWLLSRNGLHKVKRLFFSAGNFHGYFFPQQITKTKSLFLVVTCLIGNSRS